MFQAGYVASVSRYATVVLRYVAAVSPSPITGLRYANDGWPRVAAVLPSVMAGLESAAAVSRYNCHGFRYLTFVSACHSLGTKSSSDEIEQTIRLSFNPRARRRHGGDGFTSPLSNLEHLNLMADAPKQLADNTGKITTAWQTLAPNANFAGMTLAQYQAKVKPSVDARNLIASLKDQLISAETARAKADTVTNPTNQLVVNAVKGDPNYGDDSDLYAAMGYVRKSTRASGLSRKKAAPAGGK